MILSRAQWASFLLALVATSAPALDIVFDFTSFNDGPGSEGGSIESILNHDDWNGFTPASTRLTAARAVMEEAARILENAAGTSPELDFTHEVRVEWASHSNALATGGPLVGGRRIFGGVIQWDGDGSSEFFVDLTPADSSEYDAQPTDQRSTVLGTSSINVENFSYAGFGSGAVHQHPDMLTTALHEMVHTLGFGGSFPPFSDLDVDSNGTLDLVVGGETIAVPYEGGHTDFTIPWNGPGFVASYHPNLMGPAGFRSVRAGLTDVDLLIIAGIHEVADLTLLNQPVGTFPISDEGGSPPTWWPTTEAWSYLQWPYLYDSVEEKWFFFSQGTGNTTWHNNLRTGEWRNLDTSSGWLYFSSSPSFFYDFDQADWHYYSPNNQAWINDLAEDVWAIFNP